MKGWLKQHKKPAVCGCTWDSLGRRLDLRATRAAGFSLLELMVVMLLMFIMMGVATTALRGVMRGAGIRGAVATVRGVVSQARQQAMNNGSPVAVLLSQPDEGPGTMRTVMSFGRVHDVAGNVIVAENELPWTASEISGAKVYHFRAPTGGTIEAGSGAEDSRVEFTVRDADVAFSREDEIALELGTVRELAAGLRFGLLSGDSLEIVFHADGSAAQDYEFDIQERMGGAGFAVTIDELTGGITVGDIGGE